MAGSTAGYLWLGAHCPRVGGGTGRADRRGADAAAAAAEQVGVVAPALARQARSSTWSTSRRTAAARPPTTCARVAPAKGCCYDDAHADAVPLNAVKFAMTGWAARSGCLHRRPFAGVVTVGDRLAELTEGKAQS